MSSIKKSRLGVIGHKGRLGSQLLSLAKSRGYDVVLVRGRSSETVTESPDVLIDVSTAKAIDESIRLTKKYNAKLVIGTSNRSNHDNELLKKLSQTHPVLIADNFSFGHYIQMSIAGFLANLLGKAPFKPEVSVVERHPVTKLDAPSASAKSLMAQFSNEQIEASCQYLRYGLPTSDHRIEISTDDETLSIFHSIRSFKVAAEGALLAADWISGKQNKIWTMRDVYCCAT